jgi:hypothetical protein
MKVKIGKYPRIYTMYDIASWLCFWAKKEKDILGLMSQPEWVDDFGEWLTYGSVESKLTKDNPSAPWRRDASDTTILYRFLMWIQRNRKQKISVHIDSWDVWSMDSTLSHIVLPMLKQLREDHYGHPMVDDDDVPEHLRSTAAPPLTEEEKNCYASDQNAEKRWLWVLDEMIFAFQSSNDEWSEKFHSGEFDYIKEVHSWDKDGKPLSYELKEGPNHTAEFDEEGYRAYQARISNGFKLFGKYYQNLWS